MPIGIKPYEGLSRRAEWRDGVRNAVRAYACRQSAFFGNLRRLAQREMGMPDDNLAEEAPLPRGRMRHAHLRLVGHLDVSAQAEPTYDTRRGQTTGSILKPRINRRCLVAGLLALPVSGVVVAALPLGMGRSSGGKWFGAAATFLRPSGPVISRADGQIIENLDIYAAQGNGITVLHQGVVVRSCRIRHAMGRGVYAQGAAGIRLEDLDIDHIGVPPSGTGLSQNHNNIELESCPDTIIIRVRASHGSSNVYVVNCPGTQMSFLELHDARGPFPRGQNVQFNRSPDTSLQEFSAENGPTSWTEDNISVFHSDRCAVRHGLVFYNNSPTGAGVMLEGSFNCLVEDVDAVQQGNGAFSAVPQDDVGSGGCSFNRCRIRDTYNGPRDGREAPTSNGLSFHIRISEGAEKHSVRDCCVYALANPGNIIWETAAVNAGWSIERKAFDPRPPLRIAFDWQ
ncbi:hypothetical protein GOB43_15330 [Sinorhizobium meliloti]|uniref:right-handed parallel beta-helix repeat-containing protein n=1 Tax=Rhizobium meliloti TaxID=382 RepID=UPI000FDC9832|nr:right-handed parallel beta-helix repeat-containing protein [Sinorhizobium meliloti]MDW9518642.1 hypothetical protein [Sinorhizobium meliloti]MDW9758039.1 hypothetical protein [Sinorhizobium meliloti]MDX0282842.1 hypothetical protein [Sinorhizobium meliloti]MDX0285494.1 hypothetical protein [Sinorhizobium meliloti]RVK80811.1 right-handed parallel beta-helix repeat-containing protein [Sinorhizobium meliloti]